MRLAEKRIVKVIWKTGTRIATKSKKGTNTIRFIALNNIPVGTMVTYSRIVVYVQPQKEDPIIVRITVGGNIIEYPEKQISPLSRFISTP